MTNSVNSAKDLDSILFDISPKIKELAGLCEANTGIDKELFVKHDVKKRSPGCKRKRSPCGTYQHFRCMCQKDCKWRRSSVCR